ncbi:MAG: hypothetical protein HYZ14_00820 [Bacteroidetes bacterium]|nr:hypothetical protein [Bacteroidota bacterium]
MNKFRYPSLAAGCFTLLTVGFGLNLWFEPHRDVKTAEVFDEFEVTDFVTEFIKNPDAANEKYLAEDGDSKIVTMSGKITAIDTNLNQQLVIEMKSDQHDAGVRFTLLEEENEKAAALKIGEKTSITGVVSAGPVYDEDFGRYLDAILEQAYF